MAAAKFEYGNLGWIWNAYLYFPNSSQYLQIHASLFNYVKNTLFSTSKWLKPAICFIH